MSERRPDVDPAHSREGISRALVALATEARGYKSALGAVLKRLCRVGDWSYGEAWIPTHDGRGLKMGPVVLRARGDAIRALRRRGREIGFRVEQGLVGGVFATGMPRWIADLADTEAEFPHRHGLARAAGFAAAAAFPILLRGRSMATLLFFAREPRPQNASLVQKTAVALAALGPALEQKRVEMEVRAQARQHEVVANIGLRALDKSADIPSLLMEATALTAKTLGTSRAAVLELQAESGRLRVRASTGWPDASEVASAVTDPYFAAALAEQVTVNNFRNDERFEAPPLYTGAGVVSAASAVIPGRRRPLGLLCAVSRRPQRFPQGAIDFLRALAHVLGVAMERDQEDRVRERHRARLEELVVERTADLEESHERLRQAERMRAMATLARGITHDMNNVMLPALCRLDSLDAAGLPPETATDLRGVREAFDQLRRLARGLQLFAVTPDEELSFPASTRLHAWWAEVGDLLGFVLPPKVKLTGNFPAELPPVSAAAPHLTQSILNLVINSSEAIRGPGLVRLWAEPETARYVRICVADSGEGMPPEVRDRAVDPLFTTKKRSLATGLGLSIVRGFACSVGGSLSIESDEQLGTTVTLLLPVAGPAELTPDDILPRRAEVRLSDPRAEAFVTSLLTSSGFEIVQERGEGSALAVLDANGNGKEMLRYLEEDISRRLLVIGQPHRGVQGRRVSIVSEPKNLEAVRQALGTIVQDLLGITDDSF